jgi:flagellin
MRAQVRGLSMARRNTQDGISLIQTADGWLSQTSSALQRMRELAVQASNGVYMPEDRKQIQTEVVNLLKEIERVAQQAEFNKITLFTGKWMSESDALNQAAPAGPDAPDATTLGESGVGEGIRLHVGANMDQIVRVTIGNMTAEGLGLVGGDAGALSVNESLSPDAVKDTTWDWGNPERGQGIINAERSIAVLDEGIFRVNKQRTDMGAMQNRLENAMRGIEVGIENLQAAESRIRDTDMAQQMIDFVKDNILSQAATSMLAQANLRPQQILRVLG